MVLEVHGVDVVSQLKDVLLCAVFKSSKEITREGLRGKRKGELQLQ